MSNNPSLYDLAPAARQMIDKEIERFLKEGLGKHPRPGN
jgi:hypothetical protein